MFNGSPRKAFAPGFPHLKSIPSPLIFIHVTTKDTNMNTQFPELSPYPFVFCDAGETLIGGIHLDIMLA